MSERYEAGDRRPRLVKSTETLAAGLFLIALAAIGFFGSLGIDLGELAQFGAGMVPRSVSVLIAGCGLALVAAALTLDGPRLERWSWRGIVFVLGGVMAFGLTIRGYDLGPIRVPALGLVIAGPLAVTLASLADPDTRPREIVLLAVVLTALCVGLFRYVLRLPIPVAPWLIGY